MTSSQTITPTVTDSNNIQQVIRNNLQQVIRNTDSNNLEQVIRNNVSQTITSPNFTNYLEQVIRTTDRQRVVEFTNFLQEVIRINDRQTVADLTNYLEQVITNDYSNYLQQVSINTEEANNKPIEEDNNKPVEEDNNKPIEEEEPNSYDKECPVCYRNQDEDDLQLIDCNNHIACCEDCWKKLRENKCPICRESIKKTPPVDINIPPSFVNTSLFVNTISPTIGNIEQHYFREGSYLHVLCYHHGLNTQQLLYFSHSTPQYYVFKNHRFEIRKKKDWWRRLPISYTTSPQQLIIGKTIKHRHYSNINILGITRSY